MVFLDPAFLLVVGPWAALIALPLATALLRGIAAARDPMNRIVPERSPWFFFKRTLLKRLGRWWHRWIIAFFIWFALLVVSCKSYWAFLPGETMFTLEWTMLFFEYMILTLSATLLTGAACFFWAPRCKERWTLVSLAIGSAAGVYILVELIIEWFMPWNSLLVRPSYFPLPRKFYFPLDYVYDTIVSLFFLAALGPWIRHQGDRWFRLEEKE